MPSGDIAGCTLEAKYKLVVVATLENEMEGGNRGESEMPITGEAAQKVWDLNVYEYIPN